MADPVKVRRLFDQLAPSYDRYNRIFSLGLDSLWRKHLVNAVAQTNPSTILDVACGSGDVALALQRTRPEAKVTGLDFCAPLLAQARSRGLKHAVEGDALKLPFADSQFDAVTLAFGLRNFSDRKKGLHEIARVLRIGGTFALLEFSPPPLPWKLFWNFYLFHFMPWVAQILTHQGDSFRYLARSISEFPPPADLTKELESAGLHDSSARSMSLGLVRLTLCGKTSTH
jgi:demethylmenaquinone methyltransferase/2-methoxy-6-polyprenyl-1,4-benzoquinol methylase